MTKSQESQASAGNSLADTPVDHKAALKLYVWRMLHADDPDAIEFRQRYSARRPVLVPSQSPATYLARNEERRLRLPEVLRLTGLAPSTLYRYMDRGEFPRPDQLGSNTVGWKQSDINEWLRTRKKRNPSPRRKKQSAATPCKQTNADKAKE